MPIREFKSKLNWPQIFTHLLASWFFIYGIQTLSYLKNTRVVEIARNANSRDWTQEFTADNISAADLGHFTILIHLSWLLGLLGAFILSLAITIRQKQYWVNALLVLVVIGVMGWFDLSGWSYLQNIFWKPGKIFNDTGYEFLFNGILLLIIGIMIFFLHLKKAITRNRKLATIQK